MSKDSGGAYRLSCDIGGTFTDFYVSNSRTGEFAVEKCLTTPDDPSRGVLEGVRRLAERLPGLLAGTETVLHATTLVINAIIERKGARTGLVTTRGFRDVLEIGREMRYDLYDIFIEFPKPLVPRHLRLEVTERTFQNGSISIPLSEEDLDKVASEFLRHDVESVAVCFLHSYANPQNERKAKALLERLAPDMPVSISSEVLPEVREYERTTTTVANAYVKPLTARYTTRLVQGLREQGFDGQLLIMLSSGGMTSVDTAVEYPVRIVESGPAAGAVAAAYVARAAGYPEHVLAFDMGGTTAKGCVIQRGRIDRASSFESARVHRFKRGSGIPLRIPVIDIMEIGAGGGSIASLNELGLIEVGPHSAGASPGPACYGRGGSEATVSDADLVLGYLAAEHFLGGEMPLDLDAAKSAIDAVIAGPLGLTTSEAAWGIHEIVTENMAAAIRIHMAEKGVDPSRFTLVAFGGAGPVHAYALARRLGMRRILIPPGAGIASAFGLLVSPVSFDLVRTQRVALSDADSTALDARFLQMQSEAQAFVARAGSAHGIVFIRSLDICYAGQGHTVNVPLPPEEPKPSRERIRALFEQVYEELYGRRYADMDVELINLRLVAQGPAPSTGLAVIEACGNAEAARKGSRVAFSGVHGAYLEHTVYERALLCAGARLIGPAIVEERESTTIIDAGGHASVDSHGTLVIDVQEA